MIDLGAHPMYLLCALLGEPKSVQSTFTHVTGKTVEDNAVSILSFDGGAIGVSETGFVSSHYPFTIELGGVDGSLLMRNQEVEYCCAETEQRMEEGGKPARARRFAARSVGKGRKARGNLEGFRYRRRRSPDSRDGGSVSESEGLRILKSESVRTIGRSACQKRSQKAAFFAIIEAVMKMLKKETEQRQAIEMLCTDMLVPQDHLLRKIDAAVDFRHIYELVEDLYCEDNGRPSCDPVVLFKLVLIQHLFGIRSLRQTMRDAEVNVAYRWFLGYTMSQSLPHFATISYAFCHRFTAEVIEGVFRWILEEVARAGYLSPEVVFVDGTHIKANANLKKRVKKEIPVAAKRYQEQLDAEIEADRAAHGKKPLKKKDDDDDSTPSAPARQKTVTESTTDPDSGVFQKGEHRKCFAYEAHTVCDRRGYVLETEVTPGNVHDSVAFDTVFERLVEHYPETRVITADAGYKTPWICKQIFDSGRIPSLPYKRPMTKKGNLPWYEYVYDEYYDCVLCPQNQILSYSTTNREGNREYKSKSYICKNCPVRERCTENQQCTKTVTRHVWHDYIERAEDVRHSPIGKKTYSLRSQTIERVFADAKEKHAMRYTPYRGLPAVTAWVKLKFAAMNLKKLAIHKWLRLLFSAFLSYKKPDCKLAIWLL